MEIAQRLAAQYEGTRNARIEQHIVAPRRLNWQTYYQHPATFNAQITVMLDQRLQGFNLGVEMLLAGSMTPGRTSTPCRTLVAPSTCTT